jgi:large subunit ribosomal protein L30
MNNNENENQPPTPGVELDYSPGMDSDFFMFKYCGTPKRPKPDPKHFDLPEIKITLVKSPIGRLPTHRRTVRALGLTRVGSSVIQYQHPTIMGMVNQVGYLLKVEPYVRQEGDGRPVPSAQ